MVPNIIRNAASDAPAMHLTLIMIDDRPLSMEGAWSNTAVG